MAYEEKNKIVTFPHSITLDSRKKLKVTGVTDVESFDEYEIILNTSEGTLTVEGREMHMERLTLDSGEVAVAGTVVSLKYDDAPSPKSGIFSKLFS